MLGEKRWDEKKKKKFSREDKLWYKINGRRHCTLIYGWLSWECAVVCIYIWYPQEVLNIVY